MTRRFISLQRAEGIATIAFDREEALNALTLDMIEELDGLLAQIDGAADIRAVLLRGEGRAFMAGGDLDYLRAAEDAPAAAGATIRCLNRTILRLTRLSKPTVACVHGVVAGAGLSILMACDVAVAARDCRFVYAYDAIAAVPDGGLSHFLPRTLGLGGALKFAFLKGDLTADEAERLGLVAMTAPAPELLRSATAIAEKLSGRNREALVRTRRLLRENFNRTLEDQLGLERTAFMACAGTTTFQTAIETFFAERAARKLKSAGQ